MSTLLDWDIRMVKNFKYAAYGGGVFSRFLQCTIEPLADIDFDNVYITAHPFDSYRSQGPEFQWIQDSFDDQMTTMQRYGINDPYDRLFNYFLDQTSDYTYITSGTLPIGLMYTKENPIEHSVRFRRYKEVAAHFKIKNTLVNKSKRIFNNIDPRNILAVHLRIKDVDGHGHDSFTFENYVFQISVALSNYNYEKIFVATDNLSSLNKIKNIFGDLVIHHDMERSDVEYNDYSQWELLNYFKQKYWQTAIIDCFSLSYCKNLICRTSNFSNAAIVFGNYEEIYRL